MLFNRWKQVGRLTCLFILLVVLLLSALDVKGSEIPKVTTKNVVIIHTNHQGTSLTDVYDKDISEAFLRTDNTYEPNVFREYLDIDRIDYMDGYASFATYIRNKYKDIAIDGVICVGNEAYRFVNSYYFDLFSDRPVVHIGLDREAFIEPVSGHILGITEEIPFQSMFLQLLKLNPEIKKVDIYTNSDTLLANYEESLKLISDKYDVLYQVHSDMKAKEYLGDILGMSQSDGVILLSQLLDARGEKYSLDYLFDQIDLKARVPVLSTEDYYVGKGAVAAVQYDHEQYVKASVALLTKRLENQSELSDDILSPQIETDAIYDYAKVKNLELSLENFISSDIFLNKPSLMDVIKENTLEVIVLVLIIISLILIFSVVNLLLRLQAEQDREEAKQDLQISYMELEAAHEQLVASEGELSRQFYELQVKEHELVKSRERYRLAAKGSEFGIWDYDIETGKMYFSNKGKEILGLPVDQDVFSMDEFYTQFDFEQENRFRKSVERHLNRQSKDVACEAKICIDGSFEWVSIRGRALFNEDNQATRLAGSLTNVTQEKEADERIMKIAFADELTGLCNKAYFNSHLKELCTSGGCDHLALILIDLDNFKKINDSLGHKYGDEVLKKVAKILREEVGDEHEIIRYGGDEFIIILEDYQDLEDIDELAINLVVKFRDKFEIGGIGFANTLSMGIAKYPNDCGDLDTLLKNADLALNEAKANGRNQYVYYDAKIEAAMHHNIWYERELENAIEEKQFELYYQPKYHIESNLVMGYEALIRWHHPEEGLISPVDFIPVAEENGLIIKIGEWVIWEAINQLEQWHLMGNDHLIMSINLSAKQFKEVNLEQVIEQAMFNRKIEAKHIEFEITETTALHDVDLAIETLNNFRAKGYKIALDDFGTGYSSLNYLNTLPIDTLKIDKTFISDAMLNQSGEQIIKTIIELAHAHQMEVVAEGVETYEQLEFLRLESCDVIQGYYISKPMGAKEAINVKNSLLEVL